MPLKDTFVTLICLPNDFLNALVCARVHSNKLYDDENITNLPNNNHIKPEKSQRINPTVTWEYGYHHGM